MHDGEVALRLVLAVVEQDVVAVALHADAVAAESVFLRVEAPRNRRRLRPLDQRAVENLAGGLIIQLGLHRRERERRADVVKAAGGRVFRELARGQERHAIEAEEVADGVVVFRAVHAAEHDGVRAAGQLGTGEFRRGPVHDARGVGGLGLRLLLGGHLVAVERVDDFGPLLPCRSGGEVRRKHRVHAEVTLLLLRPVAAHAMLTEEGLRDLREASGVRRRRNRLRRRAEGCSQQPPSRKNRTDRVHLRRQGRPWVHRCR